MYETLDIDTSDGVATVTLNRPDRLNAGNEQMWAEISEGFDGLSDDDDVKAIVLHGAGDSFCAGADMKEEETHSHDQFEEFMVSDHGNFFDAIYGCPKPVLCAVHGWAVGAGCQIPLCCDVIYAAESATFRLPQVSLGILPAYAGVVRLARYVSQGKAAEMALLGEGLPADDAYRLGLVQDVFEDKESLLEYTMAQARELVDLPEWSVRLTKESLQTGQDVPLSQAELSDTYRFYSLVTTQAREEQHVEQREQHGAEGED